MLIFTTNTQNNESQPKIKMKILLLLAETLTSRNQCIYTTHAHAHNIRIEQQTAVIVKRW